jgi:hypothetical protein
MNRRPNARTTHGDTENRSAAFQQTFAQFARTPYFPVLSEKGIGTFANIRGYFIEYGGQ